MAILYAILSAISKSMVRSAPFYVTGVILFVLLSVQTSIMIGAMEAKSQVESVNMFLGQILENRTGIVGKQESQVILDSVKENFPIIGSYIGLADFSGHDISDIAESMTQTMLEYLNTYIWGLVKYDNNCGCSSNRNVI